MDLLWLQAKKIKVRFTYKALDLCAFLMSQSPVRVAVVSSGLCLLISSWKACKRKVSNVIWGYKKMFTSSKCFQRHIIPDLPSGTFGQYLVSERFRGYQWLYSSLSDCLSIRYVEKMAWLTERLGNASQREISSVFYIFLPSTPKLWLLILPSSCRHISL